MRTRPSWGGDGVNTFGTPDIDARAVIGAGWGPGLVNRAYGQSYGQAEVALAQANLPANLGGSQQPLDSTQPAVAARYVINWYGEYPARPGSGVNVDLQAIGMVFKWAGGAIPEPGPYIECAGQILQISQNMALFSILGTTYGGDGATTFALPDLRGRTIVGEGNGFSIGQRAGWESSFLTNSNVPTDMGGGSQPIDNMGPYLALNYLIATTGTTPSASSNTTTIGTPMIGEIVAFAGNYDPEGWVSCDGQLLAIASYGDLFAQIGTTYGGNGTTNFAVPDLRGRSLLGAGDGIAAGDMLGSETSTLTLDDIPGLTYTGGVAADSMYGGNGGDTLSGADGNDAIKSWGGADTLNGGIGNDELVAGIGNDTLNGDDGADRLYGGSNQDALNGGRNIDRLDGAGGTDTLTGGHARDMFIFRGINTGNDLITDWAPANFDKLVIDASGFGGGLAAGALAANRLVVNGAANQAFGQFLYNTATGQLSFDADGTGVATAVNTVRLFNGGVAAAGLAVTDFEVVA